MSLFFRKINICGRFPFIRLIQIVENPRCLLHIIKKNLFYKRDRTDYAPKYKDFTFLSGQETLEELIATGKSLARFSDGELDMLLGFGIYPPDSNWSQKWSSNLAKNLATTLSAQDQRLMIAVDPPSTFLASKNSKHPIPFEYNMWIDMRRTMWKYLHIGERYGHCHLFLKANCPDFNWAMFRDYIKDKNIIIATGHIERLKHLRLGKQTLFLECGSDNAYEKLEYIKSNIIKLVQDKKIPKDKTMVFACLGAAAGILAHQMLDSGICVWDTGHMFEFADKNFIESTLSHTDEAQ